MAFLTRTADRRRSAPRTAAGRLASWIAAAVLLLGGAGSVRADAPDGRAADAGPTEYQVKAAFLYNFAKFVEWPPSAFADASSPLVIGIVGDDPFGAVLDQGVSGQTVQNRPVVVKRLRESDAPGGCHVLFVGGSDERRVVAVLARLGGANVLTVGELEGFTRLGGIIGFYLDQRKVRFEINVRAAERAGLSISSHLLSVARIIR